MIIEIKDNHIYEILNAKIQDLEKDNKELVKRVDKLQKRLELIIKIK